MRPSEFAAALWPETFLADARRRWPTAPPYLYVTRLADKRSFAWTHTAGLDVYEGRPDVFLSVALGGADHSPRRPRAHQTIALASMWLDIDVAGGPEGRTHGAQDNDQALSLAYALLDPTIVVQSGHGIHAWHVFEIPWRFASEDEQYGGAEMSARWYELHRRVAERQGWKFDTSTRDLARIMRLPGTLNAKFSPPAPVTVLEHSGPRYARACVREICEQAGPVATDIRSPRGEANGDAGLLRLGGAAPPADKLHALLVNSPEFHASWTNQRGWPSLSERDLSLCSIAVQAGWDDQQLADLIHAARHGTDGERKALRGDYIRRTIARARQSGVAA